jgi:translation initiation factor IF-1
MAREGAIEAEGAIVEVLANHRYRVELGNGHRLLAFPSGRIRLGFARLAVGDKVRLELSPCDLSAGRIVVDERI